MKNGKYCNGKKSLNMKPLAVLLALTLLVGCAVGGTIAWLTDKTDDVVNTFTIGDINIDLTEEVENEFEFVPGDKMEKDPKVTVKADSEACYLFVKVTVANNSATDNMGTEDTTDDVTVNSVVKFAVENGWKYIVGGVEQTNAPTAYTNGTYYFYRNVDAATAAAGTSYFVLAGDTTYSEGYVTIDEHVTKGMVTALKQSKPTITFQAAAIQSENITDLAAAWSNLPAAFKA